MINDVRREKRLLNSIFRFFLICDNNHLDATLYKWKSHKKLHVNWNSSELKVPNGASYSYFGPLLLRELSRYS